MGLFEWLHRKMKKKPDVTVNNISFYQVNLNGEKREIDEKSGKLLIEEKTCYEVSDEVNQVEIFDDMPPHTRDFSRE